MGQAMGRRVATRFAQHANGGGEGETAVRGATIEIVVDHLGGEVALVGLGSLALERWGKALVLVVDQSPLGAPGDLLVAAVLEAALEEASGRTLRTSAIDREGTRARFLVASSSAITKVHGWLREGVTWGDALARLHAPAAASGGGA
jgi:hypothetical protein